MTGEPIIYHTIDSGIRPFKEALNKTKQQESIYLTIIFFKKLMKMEKKIESKQRSLILKEKEKVGEMELGLNVTSVSWITSICWHHQYNATLEFLPHP